MSAVLKPERRLRQMSRQDLPMVAAIETRAYAYPWSGGIFKDCLRVGYSCWVCEEGLEILGYGILSITAGDAHLLNLAVDPDRHRQGIGRWLLNQLIELARSRAVQNILLEVRPSNVAAITLYHAAGFNEVGLRKRYYPIPGGREDALIMAKVLIGDSDSPPFNG